MKKLLGFALLAIVAGCSSSNRDERPSGVRDGGPDAQAMGTGGPGQSGLPDASCAGPDFPTILELIDGGAPATMSTIEPCDCPSGVPDVGDDWSAALVGGRQCSFPVVPAAPLPFLRCGRFLAAGDFGVDYGGIEFYDEATGRPMGLFLYGGSGDKCESFDPAFTGLPTPCEPLFPPCSSDAAPGR